MTHTDRAIVLTAIADQQLTISEIASEIKANRNKLSNPLVDVVNSCNRNGFLRRVRIDGYECFEATQALPSNCYLVR